MKKIKLFLAALAAMVTMGVSAQTSPTSGVEVAAGSYYIYNLGSDAYLGKGSSYGTHAIVDGAGTVVTISGTTNEWLLHFAGIADGSYLGKDGWVDCNDQRADYSTFTFEPVSVNGYNNVYKIKANAASTYLYWFGGGAGDVYSAEARFDASPATAVNSYWILIPSGQRTVLTGASAMNPIDVTYLLTDPDNDAAVQKKETPSTTWSGDFQIQTNENAGYYTCWMEKWAGQWSTGTGTAVDGGYHLNDYKAYQTLSGLPAGKYKLVAKAAAVQQNTGESVSGAYIYAGNNTTSVTAMGNYAVEFTADGTNNVEIGMKTVSTTANWVSFDKFRLYFFGNQVSLTNATFDTNSDGWSGTAPAVNNKVAEFYNKTYDMYQSLSGLTAGIYAVEVQGFYRNAGTTNGEFRVKNQENLCSFLYATGNGTTYQTALTSIFDEAGNGGSAYSTLVGDVPNSMAQAATFFGQSLYTDNRVFVEVGTDGALTIGLKKETEKSTDWTLFDNFSVTKMNYSTLADAYAAEWTTRKSAATTLLNSSDYTNIPAGDAARTALASAVAATPSELEGYYSALTTLRSAVNGFKASKYAYDRYATVNAEITTTYAHITGTEKTALDNAESNANAIYTATATFVNAKNSYDEYYYENETATRLGADASSVSAPTTAAEAETAAHAINVINYSKFVEEEYADVSATVLGAWTDDNVISRTNQHWSGDTSKEYFEMNTGYNTATVWEMSRQQTVNLAAGTYVLKVAARVSAGADAELSVTVGSSDPIVTYAGHHGDNGKGITTDGVASYDEEDTFAGNTGKGFEWRYIPFTLDADGDVTLKFYAKNTSSNLHQYVSFCDLGIWTDPKIAARTELLTAISNATASRKEDNEGTGIFQIPVSAGTSLANAISAAQSVYDNEDAVLSDLTSATTGLGTAITGYQNTTLNAPSSSTRYKLTLANKGALTFQTTSTEGGYGMPFQTAADYKAQTFFLTQVSGNTYNLSFVDFDGNTRYICTRADYGEGGTGTAGIRTTDDSSKALGILIQPTATANVFNMLNTARDNEKLGAENGGDFYTVATNSDWSIAEASEASVELHIAAGKLATRIFPFTPTLPDGVVAYSCAANNGSSLTLTQVDTPEANKPYILYSKDEVESQYLTGWGTATADKYTEGYLTGVYTNAVVPADSYVLQTQGSVQAFYKADGVGKSSAYRAYVTVPAETGVKMFTVNLEELSDAIKTARAAGETTIRYNLAGQRVSDAQKGIVIVNGKKVLVK